MSMIRYPCDIPFKRYDLSLFLFEPLSHGQSFGVPYLKYALSLVVGTQRIIVARGFVDGSSVPGEMSVNARQSKEASQRTVSSEALFQ
ncbi:hypothetical protein AVEN_125266-1 [Araneus ventricosus]|uniref:Uncharacterized protein n=1 Tax=Araneus ventricosus TaxID=182803 RepID=A0A4Y2JUC4_ARAVE|nr:hypothetical protein AVEN_125266-1 [Araneus ventricosus]